MTVEVNYRPGPSEASVAVEQRDPGGRPAHKPAAPAATRPTAPAAPTTPPAAAARPAPAKAAVTDDRGLSLTTTPEAARLYNQGVYNILGLRKGHYDLIAQSVVADPRFALGHAAKALMAHELCAPAIVPDELYLASLYAEKATDRERSHVNAVQSHIRGSKTALVDHVRRHPKDALLLNSIMPTILFGGAVEVPAEAWDVVERAAPAYDPDDWWFLGTLSFVRQEQLRFDEGMDLAKRSLELEPAGGHAAHSRAHCHYEMGDHVDGLKFMSDWVDGPGVGADPIDHNAWHAAVHELSLGDVAAVRRRYERQLDPAKMTGCRALVDGGQLLFRWAITPGAQPSPDMRLILDLVGHEALIHPATPFHAYHAACVLTGLEDVAGLKTLAAWAAGRRQPVFREAVAPLAEAMGDLAAHRPGLAADKLALMAPQVRRLGGSDAQREIIEEARIAALLKAERFEEAVIVLEARLSRRHAPRDVAWIEWADQQARAKQTAAA
ncbi:MAG: pyridine nucleotide-disulfide oxidoreductase [Propionibacteriaceae bacterium]|jgi:hypothetical protein|nr:pyridine nucleotide-disulfide oxidoreductase [Propionibacteriaceae bacterium]